MHFIRHLTLFARRMCQRSHVCVTPNRANILNSGSRHPIKRTQSCFLLVRSEKNDYRSQSMRPCDFVDEQFGTDAN